MSILHALTGLYDRLESNREAPSYGFSRENISYAIVLSPEGSVSDVLDRRDTHSGKTPRPSRLEVPRAVKRTGQPAPNFLWDKTSFVLGAGTGESSRVLREHAAFKDFHERLLASSSDEGAEALLRFLRGWRVEEYDGLPHAQEMLDTNIVFSLKNEMEWLHERSSIKRIWLGHLAGEEGANGLCLVTGEQTAIARLHPSVKGVAGAQGSGASLVSFDKDAFRSFGKERGANAPVSERAAFAYTTSLNTLLERGSRQRIRIGDTTTLFWADASGNETRARAAEDLFSMLSDPPTDEQEAVKVRDKLAAVEQGRPLAEVEPELDGEDTRFFVLGLAPNAARLSIRFWYEDSIGAISHAGSANIGATCTLRTNTVAHSNPPPGACSSNQPRNARRKTFRRRLVGALMYARSCPDGPALSAFLDGCDQSCGLPELTRNLSGSIGWSEAPPFCRGIVLSAIYASENRCRRGGCSS